MQAICSLTWYKQFTFAYAAVSLLQCSVLSTLSVMNLFFCQGAVFSMHSNNDGFATGSKDGTVVLWDLDFKPITKLEVITSAVGYEGNCPHKVKALCKVQRCGYKQRLSWII